MRFLRFEFAGYYPSGGIDDLVGRFATLDEAKTPPTRAENVQIYDVETGALYTTRVCSVDYFNKPAPIPEDAQWFEEVRT